MKTALRVHHQGFTAIEMLVVLVIIGILSAMATPSLQNGIIRKQIEAALPLASVAMKPVETGWTENHSFLKNNQTAGLPSPDKIVNTYVSSVYINNGAVNITFGNKAHKLITGKVLTFRPAVVPDAPVVPITWVCSSAEAPKNMVAFGSDLTTVSNKYLPAECLRAGRR